tara:strand:+ start:722 stop:922 length:201 start_codon:yes stop_codon:yes gene_type:complete
MHFYTIAKTREERKQVLQFWEDMRIEAEKIYNEYTNDKDNKFHDKIYKKITRKKDAEQRPEFFEPL